MAKKKNAFLDALEQMDLGRIDMKGVSLGGDYSSVKSGDGATEPKPLSEKAPNLNAKTRLTSKSITSTQNDKKSLISQENHQKTNDNPPKPKVVRLKATFSPLKSPLSVANPQANLSISLDFLKGMDYPAQIEYLATNGWSLHLERYQGVYWEVAQKYFERRKFRLYLKALSGIPVYEDYAKTDMLVLQNLLSLKDKKVYLFRRGWSVKVHRRSHQHYEYAVRYFNRKKKMIYLGALGESSQVVLLDGKIL